MNQKLGYSWAKSKSCVSWLIDSWSYLHKLPLLLPFVQNWYEAFFFCILNSGYGLISFLEKEISIELTHIKKYRTLYVTNLSFSEIPRLLYNSYLKNFISHFPIENQKGSST